MMPELQPILDLQEAFEVHADSNLDMSFSPEGSFISDRACVGDGSGPLGAMVFRAIRLLTLFPGPRITCHQGITPASPLARMREPALDFLNSG